MHFTSDSGGLEASAPVLMNGVKIGYIDAIELQPGMKHCPFMSSCRLRNNILSRRGSTAVLFSADLLGTKAIRIEPSGNEGTASDTRIPYYHLLRMICFLPSAPR